MNQGTMKLLKAYADHNMNLTQTGRAVYMHPNTLRYHLQKVYKETGLNPWNFYDLVKLLNREDP